MAIRPLDGYPDSWGSHRVSVFPHVGPLSYVQVVAVAGTVPVTGGDTIQALEAGMKFIETIQDGFTDDGCFCVEPIPVVGSGTTTQMGQSPKTFIARWFSRVTAAIGGQNQVAGNEVVAGTNLSAETVRLTAFGPK